MTPYQLDSLKEVINIGVGRAADSLSQMLAAHVDLAVPHLEIIEPAQLEDRLLAWFGDDILSIVQLGFQGGFSGYAFLVFPPTSAVNLVDVVTGEAAQDAEPDVDEIRIGPLAEIGNIILNGVMGMYSNMLKQHFRYTLPSYYACQILQLLDLTAMSDDTWVLLAQTHFAAQDCEIAGDIILLFQMESLQPLLQAIETLDNTQL